MTMIQENFRTEIFESQKINTSFNFGFIGLGMGGTSIAAACAEISTKSTTDRYPYSALLINTNQMDLDKIQTVNPKIKKMLIGTGRGAGRDLAVGEEMYVKHTADIAEEVHSTFKESDFVWVVAGLGGGTGTGTVLRAIETLYKSDFKGRFGLILTLPRMSEGYTVISNALERLQKINKAMEILGSIILVDNQKLYDYFSEKKSGDTLISEYLQFTNEFIADALHELNVVTSSFKPTGENHFDSSEFEKLIKTPGILHLSRFSSESSNVARTRVAEQAAQFKDSIVEGVLSSGYDLSESKRLAVSILANESSSERIFNFEFTSSLESEIGNMAPLAEEKPIAFYNYDFRNMKGLYFYAVFAGLSLPERVTELIKEKNRLSELKKDSTKPKADIFGALISNDDQPATEEKSFDELFGYESKEPTTKKKSTDPADILFGD